MTQSWGFQFVDDVGRRAAETEGVVELPIGITSKRQLMEEFVRSLPLPDYFGGNWDALDECLRDRLLDDAGKPLCLLHRDLPLDQDPENCRDYLSLLEDTLSWSQEAATCNFTVLFPTATAGMIERLVAGDETS